MNFEADGINKNMGRHFKVKSHHVGLQDKHCEHFK